MELLEKNIAITRKVSSMAHGKGIPVEAEIGHVGAGMNFESHTQDGSIYTSVEEAKLFVSATGVDSLAISIGTAHGIYSGTPKLNFDRLKEIHASVDIPLVLHGGSSTGDDNLSRCARSGIAKINIFTDFILLATDTINSKKYADYFAAKRAVNWAVSKTLKHYYSIYGTHNYE